MEKMNFPKRQIDILKSYYDDNSIVCEIGGVMSDNHVLRRGLKQGCNLSPCLFSIFISDLSIRLNSVGYGATLTSKIRINHLLFADGIILISTPRRYSSSSSTHYGTGTRTSRNSHWRRAKLLTQRKTVSGQHLEDEMEK